MLRNPCCSPSTSRAIEKSDDIHFLPGLVIVRAYNYLDEPVYQALERIIGHLKLTFIAEKPPSQVIFQECLWAADPPVEYFPLFDFHDICLTYRTSHPRGRDTDNWHEVCFSKGGSAKGRFSMLRKKSVTKERS